VLQSSEGLTLRPGKNARVVWNSSFVVMALLRSISGLRATLGDALTPDVVTRHAIAFSNLTNSGPIVVGRDGRPSGLWIENILIGALRACGRTVHQLGMVPTPTVQLAVEHSNAAGGIVITASHNPEQWNGLKFVGDNGMFISPSECDQLWQLADAPAFGLIDSQQAGAVVQVTDAISDHIYRVLQLIYGNEVQGNTGSTVVVDAVNCSGSRIVPMLLEKLGYNVVRINCEGTGVFTHPPEPIPENLSQLCQAVLTYNAVFGVAVDPDADRLVLVDHSGKPIGEEFTVTLAVEAALAMHAQQNTSPDAASTRQPPTVTVNYSTTRMVDDVAHGYGAHVYRSPVGEINVVQAMMVNNSIIGGEGSGGVIYPACHSGRDAIVGLGLITKLLRDKRCTLQAACDAIPPYVMLKHKVQRSPDANIALILERCTEAFPDAVQSTDDGVHLSWSDKWVHVRMSNTEPILRIIVEAPSTEQAQYLLTTAAQLLVA